MNITFKIYNNTNLLPDLWDNLSIKNIFLSINYLTILQKTAPTNMICHFIGFFQNDELIGIALSQYINGNELKTFGNRDSSLKTMLRNFFFKNFCSHVLFIGNNMLTGQNAFSFSDKINPKDIIKSLKLASDELKMIFKSRGINIHITTFKDFNDKEIKLFEDSDYKNYFRFSTQPNMVFDIPEKLKNEDDYIQLLTKKYLHQYKRARKKCVGIEKRKMSLEDINENEKIINELYLQVARKAPFNTFFLIKSHFKVFKEILKDNFLFYGYFLDNKMIGFNTLICNGEMLDTYFLGYNENNQRDRMLYLNMLYDMIGYAISKDFKTIIFARTALEIKSSVGARPLKMYGLIEHSNYFLNKFMYKIFSNLEPKTIWQERNPFKD